MGYKYKSVVDQYTIDMFTNFLDSAFEEPKYKLTPPKPEPAPKIRFHYFKNNFNESTSGVITVASIVTKSNEIVFTVAFCSPEDNFNKSVGRDIALERWKNEENIFVADIADINSQEVRIAILSSLLTNINTVPKWAKYIIYNNMYNLMVNKNRCLAHGC